MITPSERMIQPPVAANEDVSTIPTKIMMIPTIPAMTPTNAWHLPSIKSPINWKKIRDEKCFTTQMPVYCGCDNPAATK